VAEARIELFQEASDVLSPESPVTTAGYAVGFDDPPVGPPAHRVAVDVEQIGHLSYGHKWPDFAFTFHLCTYLSFW
jgi:hypothetical protein